MLRRLHNTARVFKNAVSSEVQEIENEKGKDIEFGDIMHLVMGKRGREAESKNDPDGGIWSAGQVVGLITDIPTVETLITRLVTDAENCISQRLLSFLAPQAKL